MDQMLPFQRSIIRHKIEHMNTLCVSSHSHSSTQEEDIHISVKSFQIINISAHWPTECILHH